MLHPAGSEYPASRLAIRVAALALCVACWQCSKPLTPSPGGPSNPTGPTSPDPTVPTPGPAVFSGAGDIAIDGGNSDATAKLLDTIGGDVFTLGDIAYPNGSPENFRGAFDHTWGRHVGRMHPAPGNHEYATPGASGYFGYFGVAAGPPGRGYYSFNLGAWHIISLNSNVNEPGSGVDAGPNSPQGQWLQADLSLSRAKCTLAYWHHPLFSSGQNRSSPWMRELYRILWTANADVVLSGHDHLYERFAPQTADGAPDPDRGIREFVVGTGGVPANYQFVSSQPNSERQIRMSNGVLKLTLLADSYQWEFITTPNGAIADSGTGRCH
jgi:calcineurin-like phosphoesterase family protein